MDNVGVYRPRTTYNNKEALPSIRRFILEYIIWLKCVLYKLKLAGATILGLKSQFLILGIKVVGYICNATSRHPNKDKVAKILN